MVKHNKYVIIEGEKPAKNNKDTLTGGYKSFSVPIKGTPFDPFPNAMSPYSPMMTATSPLMSPLLTATSPVIGGPMLPSLSTMNGRPTSPILLMQNPITTNGPRMVETPDGPKFLMRNPLASPIGPYVNPFSPTLGRPQSPISPLSPIGTMNPFMPFNSGQTHIPYTGPFSATSSVIALSGVSNKVETKPADDMTGVDNGYVLIFEYNVTRRDNSKSGQALILLRNAATKKYSVIGGNLTGATTKEKRNSLNVIVRTQTLNILNIEIYNIDKELNDKKPHIDENGDRIYAIGVKTDPMNPYKGFSYQPYMFNRRIFERIEISDKWTKTDDLKYFYVDDIKTALNSAPTVSTVSSEYKLKDVQGNEVDVDANSIKIIKEALDKKLDETVLKFPARYVAAGYDTGDGNSLLRGTYTVSVDNNTVPLVSMGYTQPGFGIGYMGLY